MRLVWRNKTFLKKLDLVFVLIRFNGSDLKLGLSGPDHQKLMIRVKVNFLLNPKLPVLVQRACSRLCAACSLPEGGDHGFHRGFYEWRAPQTPTPPEWVTHSTHDASTPPLQLHQQNLCNHSGSAGFSFCRSIRVLPADVWTDWSDNGNLLLILEKDLKINRFPGSCLQEWREFLQVCFVLLPCLFREDLLIQAPQWKKKTCWTAFFRAEKHLRSHTLQWNVEGDLQVTAVPLQAPCNHVFTKVMSGFERNSKPDI